MFNITVLAIIQGITEFLPISSSGHLVLLHSFLEEGSTESYSKIVDISVHIGTLLAVFIYFWRETLGLIHGGIDLLKFKAHTPQAQNVLKLFIASLPVIIAGVILFSIKPSFFDSLMVIGWTTLIFGIILYIADRNPQTSVTVSEFTFKNALFYGFAQCIALIPGVSRSGITMTAGRFLGHSRTEAARFSLLMGMIAIAGAGLLAGISMAEDVQITNDFLILLAVGAIISFLTAYAAILLMMRWVSHASFMPFVIYRVILGVVLLGLLYGGVIPQNM